MLPMLSIVDDLFWRRNGIIGRVSPSSPKSNSDFGCTVRFPLNHAITIFHRRDYLPNGIIFGLMTSTEDLFEGSIFCILSYKSLISSGEAASL